MSLASTTLYYTTPPNTNRSTLHTLKSRPFHAAFGPIPPEATYAFVLHDSPSVTTLLEKYRRFALPLRDPPEIATFSTAASRQLRIRYDDERSLVNLDVCDPAECLLLHHVNRILPTARVGGVRRRRAWSGNRVGQLLWAVGLELTEKGSWDQEMEAFVEMQVFGKILSEWDNTSANWLQFRLDAQRWDSPTDELYPFLYKLFHPDPMRRWSPHRHFGVTVVPSSSSSSSCADAEALSSNGSEESQLASSSPVAGTGSTEGLLRRRWGYEVLDQ